MDTRSSELKRRDFLKAGVAAGAGAAILGTGMLCVSTDADDARKADTGASTPAKIPVRPFGKTGRELPILGMGGSAMIPNFKKAYGVEMLPIEKCAGMVRHAFDMGVRYFDTARIYGQSESIMGNGLLGVRDQVYIATKVADPRPDETRKSIEASLKALKTDYVDCAQIHSPVIERVGFDGAMKIHEQLLKLKDEKMVRFIGLTTHVAFETVFKLISTGGFDQALLAFGYFNRGLDTLLSEGNLDFRAKCMEKAHELKMAIVAMKVMGAGVFSHNSVNLVPGYEAEALKKLPGAAIRWVLNDQRVSMLNIGISIPKDVDDNIDVLSGNLSLTDDDQKLLADFAAKAYKAKPFSEFKTV